MKIKKYVLLLPLLGALNTYGDDMQTLNKSGTLRVGTTGDYAPISFINKKGDFDGFAVDMANALGDHLRLKITFVKTSWPTLSEDLQNKKFDIAMGGITHTPFRAKEFLLTNQVIENGKIALVRCEDAHKYQTESAINKKSVRVVVNPGGTNEKFVKSRLLNSTIIDAPNNFVPFGMILEKQADVMVTDLIEGRYQSRLYPNQLCVANKVPFNGTDSYKVYMLPKTSDHLLSKVNDWLDTMNIKAVAKTWQIEP